MYLPGQLDLIRRALSDYRLYGSGKPGKHLSWPRIVGDIGIYTEYDHASDPSDLKHAAERLRQFCEGIPKRDGTRHFRNPDIDLPFIVEFLTHPEIGRLKPDTLAHPDVSLEPALHLKAFMWDGEALEKTDRRRLGTSYFSLFPERYADEITHFEFENGPDVGIWIATVRSFSRTTSNCLRLRCGWALLLPQNEISLYVKDIASGAVDQFECRIQDDENISGLEVVQKRAFAESWSLSDNESVSNFVRLGSPYNQIHGYKFARSLVASGTKNLFVIQLCRDFYLNLKKYSIDFHKKLEGYDRKGLLEGKSYTEKYNYKMDRIKSEFENIFSALRSGDTDLFKRIVDSGADINQQEEGTLMRPLHHIALLARRAELRILLERGNLDFAVRDRKGRLPSYLAQISGLDPAMVKFLSRKEAEAGRAKGFAPTLLGDMPLP